MFLVFSGLRLTLNHSDKINDAQSGLSASILIALKPDLDALYIAYDFLQVTIK